MENYNSNYIYANLILKHLKGQLDADEQAKLNKWLGADVKHQQLFDRLTDEQLITDELELYTASDKDEVRSQLINQVTQTQITPTKSFGLWLRIAGVAAAITVITLGVWLYNISSTPRHPDHEIAAKQIFSGSDVAPGKNTATLTLANGKTINLSDGKTGVVIGNDLRYNDGTEVALLSPSGGVAREGNNHNPLWPQGGSLTGGERSRMQNLTASTPRGGTYQVVLPDGTHVWLNADSKLEFPSNFSGAKQRIVKLTGEGYFEVSRDKKHPFLVESKGQQVEVLGTHFNISAYDDEVSIKTTLLEGSVRVASSAIVNRNLSPKELLSKSVTLVPNEQASITGNSGITVKQVDASESIAWKNGRFVYKNTSVEAVMRQIARWYDVEIVYESPELKEKLLSGTVSRYEHISGILRAITLTGVVKFTIKNKTITVVKF